MGKYFFKKMHQFKMSIPVMVKLQAPALRKRHWSVLIEKTGQKFDADFKQLHLSHIFAMELYKYQVENYNMPTKANIRPKGEREKTNYT